MQLGDVQRLPQDIIAKLTTKGQIMPQSVIKQYRLL
ncbi:Uncharacterised protein [Vibrio cholerae]|nr:Uncharacterised protein [Vibrio cholerae]